MKGTLQGTHQTIQKLKYFENIQKITQVIVVSVDRWSLYGGA